MGADADRDRQRTAALVGPLREQSHVVRCDDVDAGEALFLHDEAVDAAVDTELGIARNHHAGGDHRAAVEDRGHGDRQLVEVDLVADDDHFARRRGLDVFRRDRMVDGLRELVLNLAVSLAAERHHRAPARADEAGDHRQLVADHVVEIERGVGLIDQRRDVADVHRLVQVHELAALPQAVEELAEILLHRGTPKAARGCWRPWPKLLRPASDHNPGGKGRDTVSGKKTMKALVLRKHGGLDELEVVSDHPLPTAVPGHVVIRVRASSFNYHDVFTVRGMPGIKVPLPVVVGLDMAGEIDEVGAGVTGWKVGERVLVNPLNKTKGLMGEMLDGGMAEYCLVAADQLVAMPAGVAFEEAAALPVAYGTAHRMLITHATVKAGERVLILGASGGVGTGCLILAKHLGAGTGCITLAKHFSAEVTACTSSPEKMQKLKELGADEVINVKQVDFSKWAIETYGKPQRRSYEGGVDVVINFTGGDTWHPSLRCLKRGGKLPVCGATAGYDPKEDLRYVWSFELKIIGSNSFYDDDLRALMALIADGKMRPVIDKVLPLAQAREGLRLIQDREVIGKVVVVP